ncbi:MAG: HAD-IIIA family hydrolase [Lachnospiraceae bacterium]|nr:HAD-IIIA family hydrolase [Lachnospiraceae bacterium]
MKDIKLLAMDVDGTLTDGKIYMANDGELMKAFDIKDGCAIHDILPQYGIKTAVITGRVSKIVENRAKELKIDYVFQGIKDKVSVLKTICGELGCDFAQTAYIGDDIIDIEVMKVCGVSGCPADAAKEVREICDFVAEKCGGNGAVREFSEWIVNNMHG